MFTSGGLDLGLVILVLLLHLVYITDKCTQQAETLEATPILVSLPLHILGDMSPRFLPTAAVSVSVSSR